MKAHKCDGCQNLLSFRDGYVKCIYCGCEYGEKKAPRRDWDDTLLYATTYGPAPNRTFSSMQSTATVFPSSSTTMYIGGQFSYTQGESVYF